MAKKLNYFVWLPPWTETLGGVIALNALADNLAILGERVYGYGISMYPLSHATLAPLGWNFQACFGQDCYIPSIPPITPDNTVFVHHEPEHLFWGGAPPVNAKHFVRWFLYDNSLSVVVPKEHMIFNWQDDFDIGHKALGILAPINAMSDEFHNKGFRRSNECFLVRKAWYKTRDKHQEYAICIDNYSSNQALSQIFNTTERFICYDHNSFLPVQAALCGCLPIVVPHPTMKLKKHKVFKYGVAFGFDEKEIAWAKETMPMVRDYIKDVEKEGLLQTGDFVNICEDFVLNK